MLYSFSSIKQEYNLHISGIIHAGGNKGEEIPTYIENEIKNIVSFEPLKKAFVDLKNCAEDYNNRIEDANIKVYNIALGNENKDVEMYVSSGFTECSSVMEPKEVRVDYPSIIFDERELVEMKRLDDHYYNECLSCNFLNMDVQGYELEILKGSAETLKHIDYVYCEVNNKELYANCPLIENIDEYLLNYNIKRVAVNWQGGSWGDALYIKENFDK
jgi:FkbM family methyltransferase